MRVGLHSGWSLMGWQSMGVLLFFMCTGTFPFYGDTDEKIRAKVLKSSFRSPFFLSLGGIFMAARHIDGCVQSARTWCGGC